MGFVLLTVRRLRDDQRGSIALLSAITILVVLLAVGGAVDLGRSYSARSALQSVADTSAIAAAKQFLRGAKKNSIFRSVVKTYIKAHLDNGHQVTATDVQVDHRNRSVRVEIHGAVRHHFLSMFGSALATFKAVTTAQLQGRQVVCLLALNERSPEALTIDSSSVVSPGCDIHSNSSSAGGLAAKGMARAVAREVCTSGGVRGAYAFKPSALVDCPVFEDPLADRAFDSSRGCSASKLVIRRGNHTLRPGNYCGGLVIKGKAHVTMSGGIFVMKNGPLKLQGGATLIAKGASIHLDGAESVLDFDNTSHIDLTAASDGPLAGILFYENRNHEAVTEKIHRIGSRQAPNLLGTIYLPHGALYVGGKPSKARSGAFCRRDDDDDDDDDEDDDDDDGPKEQCPPKPANVGSTSAWTVIIAKRVNVNSGFRLVLNSDYGANPTKPPEEVLPRNVRLAR